MEYVTHDPRFMKWLPRYEPVIADHSSRIVWKTCQRKYFYRIVLGYVPRETPQYFLFGSCYHKFREVLELQFLGLDEKDKKKIGLDPDWQIQAFGKGLQAAMDLWKAKKGKDPVAGDKWDFLTHSRMMESCAVVMKAWQKEKEQGRIVVLATEQMVIVTMKDGTKVAGRADQIVRWNNKVWGRDFKTSSKEQNAYYTRMLDPNDQFTRYTWLEQEVSGEPVEGQIVEVLYNAKGTKTTLKKGPELFTHMATRSPRQLDQWVREQMFIEEQMKLNRQHDVWPMEEHNCSWCPYHSVCKQPSERSQAAKLEAEFKLEPWDCVNRDGDE